MYEVEELDLDMDRVKVEEVVDAAVVAVTVVVGSVK